MIFPFMRGSDRVERRPSQSKEAPSAGFAIGLLLFGLFAGVAGRIVEKPLVCSDDRALAASYSVRFFLRIAFSESAGRRSLP
jgi:pilus assembly protein TadC